MKIIPPNRQDPISEGNGTPSTRFANVVEDLVNAFNDLIALPVREISEDTTLVLEDGGTVIRNVGGNVTVTIPAVENQVDVGTWVEFQNDGTGIMTIIAEDTLTSSAGLGTGTRAIAVDGEARILLVAPTQWKIRGEQIT